MSRGQPEQRRVRCRRCRTQVLPERLDGHGWCESCVVQLELPEPEDDS